MGCARLGIFASLFLLSSSAFADGLERRPYLQSVTSSSAVLVWTTLTPTDAVVRFGPSAKDLSKTVAEKGIKKQHEVRLTGLSADTRYCYKVGDSYGFYEGGDLSHCFRTAPQVGDRKRIRAWILGDSGTGSEQQRAVRDAMLRYTASARPDLFLHMGDIAYSYGLHQEFTSYFFRAYEDILTSTVTFPTLGNHEGFSSDSGTQVGTYYSAYVLPKAGEAGGLASGTEAYYSFDWGNAHFIVLDSQDSPRDADGAMLTWMKADLQATTQEWVIAYWHHPAYSWGSHNSDLEAQLAEMRVNALPILEAGGVDLVLAGHSHIYERSYLVDGAYDTPTVAAGHVLDMGDGRPLGSGPYQKPAGLTAHQGAVYVVAGHGGATLGGFGGHPVMYMSELHHGSCILDIHENRLSLVNVRWDGEVTDRFAMVKGTGLVLAAPDGEEALRAGDPYEVRWATSGDVAEVVLSLSTDDGQTFTPFAGPMPNTGSYFWTVPAVNTRAALVRVESALSASARDESNARFSMTKDAPSIVIPFGSRFRYHDLGMPLGLDWLAPGFDDSSWQEGPAQLGYGEGDEATVLRQTMPTAPTFYFRKHFTLQSEVVMAKLRVIHDDGVAVWINGVPVFSEKMAGGFDYSAWASQLSADNELSEGVIPLAASPFVLGENVLTAMVKQKDALSSDLSFDLELSAVLSGSAAGGAGGAGGAWDLVVGVGSGPMPPGPSGGAGGQASGGGGCGCRFTGTYETPEWMLIGLALGKLRWRRKAAIASRRKQG